MAVGFECDAGGGAGAKRAELVNLSAVGKHADGRGEADIGGEQGDQKRQPRDEAATANAYIDDAFSHTYRIGMSGMFERVPTG